MTARIEMEGQRFGKWTVISYAGSQKWTCRCDCGVERLVDGRSVRHGRSSGCASCREGAHPPVKHGGAGTRLYNIWCGMKARCLNANEPAFERYGARGITICDEWENDFAAFQTWAMSNGYTDNLTIDREDNDGPYSPTNCRWATYAEQNRNYGRNVWIEYEGRRVLIGDLAAEHGLPADLVKNRVRRYGWSIEKALSTPVLSRGRRA